MGKPTLSTEMPLNPQLVLGPFEKWGIDFVRPFDPPSYGKEYFLVCTNYVTKWVEVQALESANEDVVAEFLYNRIMLRRWSTNGKRNVELDVRDSIIQKMGWNADEVNISNINSVDTMVGHATLYEFDIQIGNAILPVRLSEDVKSWEFVEHDDANDDEESHTTLAKRPGQFAPVLAPFQLAGPLELWIQDADHMRLSVPHDVEAGVLKKVMLTDGAVVTVKGAREMSLSQPIQLPLTLGSKTGDGSPSSSLIALAAKLKRASSNEGSPLSLRIVGPSSLVASSISEPESTSKKLKVKRLAPGSVELVSRQQQETSPSVSLEAAGDTLGPKDMWMWPFPSVNGSDPKLLGFQELLNALLGSNVQKKGSFKLLKAQAAPATFVKMQFELEKKLGGEMYNSSMWPEWRTKPSVVRLQFEMTAKVEGGKLLPVNVQQIEPVAAVESHS
ncbi:hypothetical protein KI387_012686, partial [Taxus chinensis]